MILVDSSVWIDYINDLETAQTQKLDSLFGTTSVAVGDLMMAEVLQGCSDAKKFNETVQLFQLADFMVIGGYFVALAAARNYIALRSKGYTVRKTIDTMIASHCILNGIELLHNDRDFEPFQTHLGLRCVAC